jgi:hypothetical protein
MLGEPEPILPHPRSAEYARRAKANSYQLGVKIDLAMWAIAAATIILSGCQQGDPLEKSIEEARYNGADVLARDSDFHTVNARFFISQVSDRDRKSYWDSSSGFEGNSVSIILTNIPIGIKCEKLEGLAHRDSGEYLVPISVQIDSKSSLQGFFEIKGKAVLHGWTFGGGKEAMVSVRIPIFVAATKQEASFVVERLLATKRNNTPLTGKQKWVGLLVSFMISLGFATSLIVFGLMRKKKGVG